MTTREIRFWQETQVVPLKGNRDGREHIGPGWKFGVREGKRKEGMSMGVVKEAREEVDKCGGVSCFGEERGRVEGIIKTGCGVYA